LSDAPDSSAPRPFGATPRRWWQAAAVVWTALIGFGFIAAPRSCEWGLEAYTWTGLALLLIALVLPISTDAPKRDWHALGLAVVTLGVWCAGIFVADLQLLCRLF
jgi:hypothetical protein